jgi:hypothetical protein
MVLRVIEEGWSTEYFRTVRVSGERARAAPEMLRADAPESCLLSALDRLGAAMLMQRFALLRL